MLVVVSAGNSGGISSINPHPHTTFKNYSSSYTPTRHDETLIKYIFNWTWNGNNANKSLIHSNWEELSDLRKKCIKLELVYRSPVGDGIRITFIRIYAYIYTLFDDICLSHLMKRGYFPKSIYYIGASRKERDGVAFDRNNSDSSIRSRRAPI